MIASLITTAFKSERCSAPVHLKTMKALSNSSLMSKQNNYSVCKQRANAFNREQCCSAVRQVLDFEDVVSVVQANMKYYCVLIDLKLEDRRVILKVIIKNLIQFL